MYSFVLTSLLFASMQVQAGSGAGGIISFKNNTSENIEVNWGGWGCAGVRGGLSLSCQDAVIGSKRKATYSYNWGVTDTWINIGIYSDKYTHACAHGGNENCLYNHRIVRTKGWKKDRCTLYELKGVYSLKCFKE